MKEMLALFPQASVIWAGVTSLEPKQGGSQGWTVQGCGSWGRCDSKGRPLTWSAWSPLHGPTIFRSRGAPYS